MQASPDDEGPVRAVPEAAEQHRQHQVDVGAELRAAVAAERNVEIVAQPRRQRDVPATPEIRKADRRVRHAEVVGQREAEAERDAHRSRRVAREVAEDLARECERPEPGVREADRVRRTEHSVSDVREPGIGQDDLHEEPEHDEVEAPEQLVARRLPRRRELGHELGRAHDRAGDQVREVRYEERVVEERPDRLQAPEIHVERVGQRHERIERDADRKDDVPLGRNPGDAERGHQGLPVLQQELAVFEEADEPDVDRDRDHEP